MTQPKTYLHRKICPGCGQEILIPNEITSINLRGRERLILMKLYRANGAIVHSTTLNEGRQISSLAVHLSHIRTALRETGAPFKITNHYDLGYSLDRTQ